MFYGSNKVQIEELNTNISEVDEETSQYHEQIPINTSFSSENLEIADLNSNKVSNATPVNKNDRNNDVNTMTPSQDANDTSNNDNHGSEIQNVEPDNKKI